MGCAGVTTSPVSAARSVTGPYLDKNGISMMVGGGTQLTWPDDQWKGPGHNAVFQDDDGSWWLIHHAYNAYDNGYFYMRIHKLFWTPNGWPSLTEATCAQVHNAGAGLPPDWVPDCYVDIDDLQFLAEEWSNGYNLQDFVDLATYWLQCNEPSDDNCIMNW